MTPSVSENLNESNFQKGGDRHRGDAAKLGLTASKRIASANRLQIKWEILQTINCGGHIAGQTAVKYQSSDSQIWVKRKIGSNFGQIKEPLRKI